MTTPQHDATRARGALARLLGPAGPELTCEECFGRLDEYVELDTSGIAADRAVPGMRAHLDGCAACREEHDSLRALLAHDAGEQSSSSHDDAVASLHRRQAYPQLELGKEQQPDEGERHD